MNLLPFSLLSPESLLGVARKNYARGNKRQALQAIDTALEKLAKRSSSVFKASYTDSSQANEAWLLKGHIHEELGENSSATAAFFSAYDLSAIDVDALDFLTSELLAAKDLSERAKRVYLDYLSETHHTKNPERARGNLRLLEALSAPDWLRPEAIDLTEQWNELISSRRNDLPWPCRYLGEIALRFNDYWTAISHLQQGCDLAPGDNKTRQNLAYALFKAGRFGEAKDHLDHLLTRQPNGGALLLRAHVHRALRDFTAAALDYRWVSESNLLTDDERLAYAEVCINAGYFDEAAGQLGLLESYYDSRWLLLSAMVDHAEQHDDKALMKFRELIALVEFCPQAVAQTLRLLAENPEARGGLDALNEVPADYQDDLYWSVKGNVLLCLGCTEAALSAWREVVYPDYELRETINSVGRYYFSTLYAKGQDLNIIRAVRRDLVYEMRSDEVAEIVVSALSRFTLKNLGFTPRPKKFLKDIDLVAASFPDYGEPEKLDLLRALAYTARFDYDKAAEIYSTLGPAYTRNEEVAFQIARCAIHSGSAVDCLEALESLGSHQQRATKIRCALSALKGDWEAAAQHFPEGQSSKIHDELKAALYFRAGRWRDLKSLNGSAVHSARYYQIAQLLQSGDHDAALQILRSIPADEPNKARANWLFGWLHVQAASNCRSTGEQTREDENLTDSLILWPESSGPASCLKTLDARLMSTLLLNGNGVEAFGGVLEARAASRGFSDPASCHNLGLLHFCNGVRSAVSDDFERALESWERSIAYICVPLCNQEYMTDWVRRRLQSYGTYQLPESVQIENDLLQYYDATFKRWSEELGNRSRPVEAAKVSDLALALRAELQGARVLNTLGGFCVAPNSLDKISAGPIFISMMRYDRTFAVFLNQLKLKYMDLPDSTEDDPVAALLELITKWEDEEKEGAVDPSVKARIQKLFSVLRFATVRQEEGNLESALRRLREVKSPARAWLASRSHRKTRFKGACVDLAHRSPAFARKGAASDFRNLVHRYEVELLIALGEHDVASSDNRVASGIQYWREALSLARVTDEYQGVVEKIRDSAMGRAYVLRDKRQLEEAIQLLEDVYELCADEEVRNLLSKLHAVQGVMAGNNGDLEMAVSKLRQATDLNPHSMYARSNLATALLFLVDDVRHSDPLLARMLVEEALEAIDVCRNLDEHNEEYRDTQILTMAKLNFLRIELGEISMDDLSPADVIGLLVLETK